MLRAGRAPAILAAPLAAFGIGGSLVWALHVFEQFGRVVGTPTSAVHAKGAGNHGTQLVMVLIGSSRCGASRTSVVGKAALRIRDSLRVVAGARSIPFVSVGVAVDDEPSMGLKWLSEIGGFDEVSAGQGWLNTAAWTYLGRTPPALAATPQIAVILRSFVQERGRVIVSPESVLIRMIGASDITAMAGLTYVDSLVAGRAQALLSPR